MPTFNDDRYNLLLDRQRKHVRWLMDQGIKEGSGVLLIAGGVGETYFLEDDEFRALTDLLADEVRGTVPTMVMVSELNARRAAAKARYAADAGIDFVLLSPPHYSLPSEGDIFLHHKYVNDAADIGIVVYNSYWVMPGPGYEFSPALFEQFATLENIVGVKWSASNASNYLGMQTLFGERFNFIENMFVLSLGPRFGTTGFIDMYGNATPRLSLHLWGLLQAGKYDEYEEVFRKYKFDPFVDRPGPVSRKGASPWAMPPTHYWCCGYWALTPGLPCPHRRPFPRAISSTSAGLSKQAVSRTGLTGIRRYSTSRCTPIGQLWGTAKALISR